MYIETLYFTGGEPCLLFLFQNISLRAAWACHWPLGRFEKQQKVLPVESNVSIHIAWSAPILKTFENVRKLDFFRLPAPAAVLAHLGASSLKKSNFLTFSKVLRIGPDQAKYIDKILDNIILKK